MHLEGCDLYFGYSRVGSRSLEVKSTHESGPILVFGQEKKLPTCKAVFTYAIEV